MTMYFDATTVETVKPLAPIEALFEVARNTPINPRINTRWFQHQFELRNISQAEVARKILKIDPATLSLILAGKRQLKMEVAITLAQFLSVPLEEVLQNAGMPTKGVVSKENVKIVGTVDAAGKVSMGTPKSGSKVAPPPAWGGRGLKALKYQTAGTPLEGVNGALVYFQEAEGVAAEAFGRMCVIAIEAIRGIQDSNAAGEVATEELYFGTLGRGDSPGRYSVKDMAGRVIVEDARVISASPVVWMKI